MKLKSIIFSLLIATVALSSCGKYDEGPGMSLRSKKSRLVNAWAIESIEVDGNASKDGISYVQLLGEFGVLFTELEIKEDGTYAEKYDSETIKGKWEFADGKKKLKITPEGGEVMDNTILKLKNESLWIQMEMDFFGTGTKNKVVYKLKGRSTI